MTGPGQTHGIEKMMIPLMVRIQIDHGFNRLLQVIQASGILQFAPVADRIPQFLLEVLFEMILPKPVYIENIAGIESVLDLIQTVKKFVHNLGPSGEAFLLVGHGSHIKRRSAQHDENG